MPKVTIYSTQTCPYCIKAKEFFKEHKVEYQEFDVSRNEAVLQDMIDKSGQLGVPVIDIDGKIVVGYNKPKLTELLGLNS